MIDTIIADAEDRMKKAVSNVRHEFATVRTGRASAVILERVTVDYYGTPTPLIQLANITAPEPQMLVVHPYDKTQMAAMEKAIQASDLGITPSNDGNVIRLPFPAPTEERRKELVKLIHKLAEEGRVAVRNIRRDANNHLKDALKKKEIAEDEERRTQDEIQKLTDRFVAEIDKALLAKEADLMAV